jgi:hypothetical protein
MAELKMYGVKLGNTGRVVMTGTKDECEERAAYLRAIGCPALVVYLG